MDKNPDHRGTDNILADLGFPDAEELTAKTILAKKVNDVIDNRHFTQSEAPELLGMPQPKISAIRNYKLQGISLERLMLALTALGQHVEISVSPSTRRVPARRPRHWRARRTCPARGRRRAPDAPTRPRARSHRGGPPPG